MNKGVLLTLFLIIVVVIFFAISHHFIKQEAQRRTYLCDKQTADCGNKVTPSVPKGVCIPGGKCT